MKSVSLVGAVGGAGTTRTCLEFGAMLARDGRSVVMLDAAYATQGLSDHVPGRIERDITALVLDDASLASGLVDLDPFHSGESGRLACCPAHAPFERLARAKTTDAARRFEELITEAMNSFDHVLVDTPPVASNQAIAAVTGVEQVGIVTPANQRGTDGLARTRDRLADIGVTETRTIRTNVKTKEINDVPDADAVLPTPATADPDRLPTSAQGTDPYTVAVADALEAVFDLELDVALDTKGIRSRLSTR